MYVATDLHGHTFFSDGRATPEEYVNFRRQLGMTVIAIADHDVLAAVRRGAQAAAQAGLVFVPALEVTSFLHFGTKDAEQFHVLAYFSNDFLDGARLEQTALYKRGLRVQEKWKDFVVAWLHTLAEDDRTVLEAARLESLPPGAFPALQSCIDHIVMRKRELFDSFRDHHWRFWNDDPELFGWSPEEAIDFIRADGAIDIVAHPVRYRDRVRTNEVLEYASGLEVYTSRHKAEVSAEFRAFAEERRKFWTSSSDDHQNAAYYRPPCGTPARTIERILKKTIPLHLIVAA